MRWCLLAAEGVKPDKRDGSFRVLGNVYWTEACAGLDSTRTYTVRFDPTDATVPINIEDNGVYLFDVPLRDRSGYRDHQSLKSHKQAKARWLKSAKAQAAAERKMTDASAWLATETESVDLETGEIPDAWPSPKVVELQTALPRSRPSSNDDGPSDDPYYRRCYENFKRRIT